MATYIERTDEGFAVQISKFCQTVDTYKTILGLDTAKVDGFKKDQELFVFVFTFMLTFRDFSEGFTNYKKLLRYGHGNQVLGALPVIPVYPVTTPTITSANMQQRFAVLIQDCVKSPNYTTTIGDNLGIEAAVTPFNPAAGKPVLTPGYSTAGHPELKWKKGKFQGIEVWIDRGDGKGWVALDKDFNPDFTDKISPLPAPGVSAVWKYKAIYLYKGEQVGQWSETISITVQGSV